MTLPLFLLIIALVGMLLLGGVIGLAACQVRRRHAHGWLIPYLRQCGKRRPGRRGEPIHLLLCVADHFEPKLGEASAAGAQARVAAWTQEYPRLFGRLRDSDGRPPRHTFFYPIEEYEAGHLEALAQLCRAGFGEVEIHLHHDADTAEGLREKLLAFRKLLADRHGLLARRRETGALAYGFIHGNWALDNSRPDGRWCGVNNELDVLRETGCYADFTLPSAPSPTQTRKTNAIYYARDDPERPKSHDWGIDVGAGPPPADSLMLIQGPLLLDWARRKWALFPRIENGCLQASQLPSLRRLELWLQARIQVPARPDWFFVKLHTHGASEPNRKFLLGEPMVRFHRALAQRAEEGRKFRFHYVTAREMFNLVRAAETGWKGSVEEALDWDLVWNGGWPGAGDLSGLRQWSGRKLSPGSAAAPH